MMKPLWLLGQSATLGVGVLAWSGCAAEPPAAVSVPETETIQPLEEDIHNILRQELFRVVLDAVATAGERVAES